MATEKQNKKKVILVEDDSEIRNGFQMLINSSDDYFIVGTYSSAEDLLKEIEDKLPDIILMDLELPGMGGIAAIKIIKNRQPGIEILVVTVYEDTDLVFDALKSGASGYITKSSNYSKLLNALDEISQGGAPMSTKIARLVIGSLRLNTKTPLTKRETDILQLLAEGKTYIQISEELFISRDTVKTHLKHIYSKLYVKSRAEAVAKASKDRLI